MIWERLNTSLQYVRESDWEKMGIVVVHIEADFVKQIFASDHIAVQTAVSKIGTKSFHLIQRVH